MQSSCRLQDVAGGWDRWRHRFIGLQRASERARYELVATGASRACCQKISVWVRGLKFTASERFKFATMLLFSQARRIRRPMKLLLRFAALEITHQPHPFVGISDDWPLARARHFSD
jgi:hypothetical protein